MPWRLGDVQSKADGNWHLGLCNMTWVSKALILRHHLRSQPFFPALIVFQSCFPWAVFLRSEETASVAAKFSPLHRPSFQIRPRVHRGQFLSPGSLWTGTTVTNSAQGVDYPGSQPSLWLPSHLHSCSRGPSTPPWARV